VTFEISRRRALLLAATPVVLALMAVALYVARRADHTRIAPPPADIASPRAAFPLSVAAGKRYLVDKNGVPFLIQGDAAWSLIAQRTREEAELYIETRRRGGFNLLMVNLLEHWFGDHTPLDAYGTAPFRVSGDFSTPNDQYFERARAVVRMALDKGMVVLLCAAYLGGDGGQEGWYEEMRRSGPEKLFGYGQYVGAKFREFPNVIWLAAGDYVPPAAALPLVDAVQRGIRQASPEQLETAHWNPETSALDVKFASTPFFAFNTTYSYLPAYLKSRIDYAHGQSKPHLFIESKYEFDPDRGTTQQWLRAQAYYALLTGAMGQIYGHWWGFMSLDPTLRRRITGKDWKSSLDSPGVRSMGHLHQLFAKLPWTTLVPDETYEVLLTGQGWQGSIRFPVLARSADGSLAVAYLPHDPITIDLDRLQKPLRARFYDPTDGTFSDVPGSPLTAGGHREFAPPAKNASGDRDWVLLLEAAR
jgi:hypothetical protein